MIDGFIQDCLFLGEIIRFVKMLKEDHPDNGHLPHHNSLNNNIENGPSHRNNSNGVCANTTATNSGSNGNAICSGCGHRILDRYYVLAVDRQWHNECLKCHNCAIVLSNQLTCFSRDGLILCKEDYYR